MGFARPRLDGKCSRQQAAGSFTHPRLNENDPSMRSATQGAGGGVDPNPCVSASLREAVLSEQGRGDRTVAWADYVTVIEARTA